jgi:hypothetical protein
VAAFVMHLLTRARDREARKAERESLIADRRREFQRETLLAVLDETMQLIATTRKVRGLKSSAEWPNGLWSSFISTRDRIDVLKFRVRDIEITKELQMLDDLCLGSTYLLRLDEEGKKAAMKKANEISDRLNQMIGERLAALDAFE